MNHLLECCGFHFQINNPNVGVALKEYGLNTTAAITTHNYIQVCQNKEK